MMIALLLALQALDPLQPAVPSSEGLKAAEQQNQRRLPIIVKICRDALRSPDRGAHVRRYADEHGLSTYGRIALQMDCSIYWQGRRDGGEGPLPGQRRNGGSQEDMR
ncbi:hypothetical protein [Sphingomonas solaris]|uniref:Uncharacterized protein n=1 Tax=Alterirhizorhabdus solaris TaxID=2529389 RepID=A0A558QSB8_9SPHN|nr:hypothetical protein [Sphingomonas solaris]TVV69952.1 hypothetical protein FOY91_20325 [Sphingomonas solaris]